MPAVEEKPVLTGDLLIQYGFKRVTEQLTELIDVAYQINNTLGELVDLEKKAETRDKLTAGKIDKMENHLFSIAGTDLSIENRLDQARADTFTTAMNVIRILQALNKEDDADERMEESV